MGGDEDDGDVVAGAARAWSSVPVMRGMRRAPGRPHRARGEHREIRRRRVVRTASPTERSRLLRASRTERSSSTTWTRSDWVMEMRFWHRLTIKSAGRISVRHPRALILAGVVGLKSDLQGAIDQWGLFSGVAGCRRVVFRRRGL